MVATVTLITFDIWALYNKTIPVLRYSSEIDCNFYISLCFNILLSIFEWIQIPMIITPVYNFRFNDKSSDLMALSVLSFCFGLSCYLLNTYVYWKRYQEGDINKAFFYQKLANTYFICFSFCACLMK
jgi:hypothetical protein